MCTGNNAVTKAPTATHFITLHTLRTLSVEDEFVDVESFLVLACLGWLFEVGAKRSALVQLQLQVHVQLFNSRSQIFQALSSLSIWRVRHHLKLPLLYHVQSIRYRLSWIAPNYTCTCTCLAFFQTNLVSRELLYTCCPFLGEIWMLVLASDLCVCWCNCIPSHAYSIHSWDTYHVGRVCCWSPLENQWVKGPFPWILLMLCFYSVYCVSVRSYSKNQAYLRWDRKATNITVISNAG